MKIGFVPIGESDTTATWTVVDSEEEFKATTPSNPDNDVSAFIGKMFKAIDQEASDLEEELVIDDYGNIYKTTMSVAVRRKEDIEMAERYSGKPVVIHVWTVDGRHVHIGSEDAPARMKTQDSYRNMSTRELLIRAEYNTIDGLLRS